MSYRLKINPKDRAAARFIARLQKVIQNALIDSGKTQQQVADILDVDRSVVNRRLKGSANLTARSIAEFAYALDKDIILELSDKRKPADRTNVAAAENNIVSLTGARKITGSGTAPKLSSYTLERAQL